MCQQYLSQQLITSWASDETAIAIKLFDPI